MRTFAQNPSFAQRYQFSVLVVSELLSKTLKRPVTVINDADAAGYAEVYFGAAHGHNGTIIVLTLGTGIGSALVHNGVLLPNSELGHVILADVRRLRSGLLLAFLSVTGFLMRNGQRDFR